MVTSKFTIENHSVYLIHTDKFTLTSEYGGSVVSSQDYVDYREARIDFFIMQKVLLDAFLEKDVYPVDV